jgi:S-adenosylmethionine hydrolase
MPSWKNKQKRFFNLQVQAPCESDTKGKRKAYSKSQGSKEQRQRVTAPIITLLSDFGLKDPYVAEMKAVILSICPQARIVDVSHEIEKFNIRMGAFVLASASPYFPKGTIHVAVVDPGVGTKRRALFVETEYGFFVGPDNGLLMLAAQKQGIRRVYSITNKRFMLPHVSRTFHGRDIFALVAAHLAKGCKLADFGPEIHDYAIPKFAKPRSTKKALLGEVLHVDDFGNIVTNISGAEFEKTGIREGATFRFRLKNKTIKLKFCSAYGEAPVGKSLALIGSHDFLEISTNQRNASKKLGARVGDAVAVLRTTM